MIRLSNRQWGIVLVMLLLALLPTVALGAGMPVRIVPPECDQPGGCQSICSIADLAQNILNSAIFIAVFLAAILFAYAGLQMITSPTNPARFGKARNLLFNVLVGFIVILGAWLVVNAIMSVMVSGSAGLPWNKIC